MTYPIHHKPVKEKKIPVSVVASKYYIEDGAGNVVSTTFSAREIIHGYDLDWIYENSPGGFYYLRVCEFTGYADMEGRLIYRGDVLVHRETSTLAGIWRVVRRVKKRKTVYYLRDIMVTGSDYVIPLKKHAAHCEIVGNVYDRNRSYLRNIPVAFTVLQSSWGACEITDIKPGRRIQFSTSKNFLK